MARKPSKPKGRIWGTGNPDKDDEALMNAAFVRWMDRAVEIKKRVESPIEQKLAQTIAAIWTETIGGPIHFFSGTEFPRDDLPEGMSMIFQAPVLTYRIDFMLMVKARDGSGAALAVECDGHDFHERTKEQAAHDRSRDRAIMLAGIRVVRFTGSEIFKDVLGCAEEALQHLGSIQYPGGPEDGAD